MASTLRMRVEWECSPLWLESETDGLTNIEPKILEISNMLIARIEKWDDSFQSIFNRSDPRSSGFVNPKYEEEFNMQGRRIAKALAAELGAEWKVSLYPCFGDNWVETFQIDGAAESDS